MLKKITESLEQIARAAKSSAEPAKTEEAIRAARTLIQNANAGSVGEGGKELEVLLNKLDSELATWQTKLPVILKESIGRQGIAKHTSYWVEQLKKCQTN